MTFNLAIYASIGVLLMLLAIPMLQQRFPPNRWIGWRTSRTLADPKMWYAVNAFVARYLLLMGAGILVAAIVLFFVPNLSVDAYALLVTGVMLGLLTLLIVQGYRYQNRYEP